MSTRANLLPEAFARRRRERRRRRAWVTACGLILAAQCVASFLVERRARDVRRWRDQAVKLQTSLRQEKAERDALRAKAQTVARHVELAERLREKHCWSRWLGSLSLMVPPHVVLTAVETEPPRFDAAPSGGTPGPSGAKDRPAETGPRAIRIRGSAAQHEDLMALYKTMNGLTWFHSVQLEEARRQKVAEHDTIGFALACNW